MMISGPISGAILPRMSRLQAEGNDLGVIQLYRKATQLVAVIAAPVALLLAFFSEQVLWAWTGNALLVSKAASVLTLYAIGSGILALGAFPYYLQYAKGDLKLHLIGSFLFVFLLIPSIILATLHYGMIGAGWAWLAANLAYFLFWVPLVHIRFAPGLHWPWLFGDVISVCLPVTSCAWLVHHFSSWGDGRLAVTVQLSLLGSLLLMIAFLSSSNIRALLGSRYRMASVWMARKRE